MLYLKKPTANVFLGLCLVLCFIFASIAPANAANHSSLSIEELDVSAEEQQLYLTAQLRLKLSESVILALYKGITVPFVIEVDVIRQRWYWYSDQKIQVKRYLQLSYQPLLEKWSLAVSSEPGKLGGLLFSREFDSYRQAINALQRVYRWEFATQHQLNPDNDYAVQFKFYLDSAQLPRVMRIGGLDRQDWDIAVQQTIPLDLNAVTTPQIDSEVDGE